MLGKDSLNRLEVWRWQDEEEGLRIAGARGAKFLASLQGPDGGWSHQAPSGVFFSTAALDYRLYKDVFPTWALACFERNRPT